VFPYIAGLQAALTAFVGEREHGTLGPLLATRLRTCRSSRGSFSEQPTFRAWPRAAVGFAAFLAFLHGKTSDPLSIVAHSTLIETAALSLIAGFAMVVFGLLLGSKSKSVRGAQAITAVVVFPVIFGVQVLAQIVLNQLLSSRSNPRGEPQARDREDEGRASAPRETRRCGSGRSAEDLDAEDPPGTPRRL